MINDAHFTVMADTAGFRGRTVHCPVSIRTMMIVDDDYRWQPCDRRQPVRILRLHTRLLHRHWTSFGLQNIMLMSISIILVTCLNIVKNIAPLKCKRSKEKSVPLFNDSIRSLRQVCRRAEHKFRKDRLQVSNEMLKESLSFFQKAVKSAKSKFLTEIVAKKIPGSSFQL